MLVLWEWVTEQLLLNKPVMVKECILHKRRVYQCQDCKLYYKDKRWAEKCEEWCLAHHTCNIAITKHKLNADLIKNVKGF